MERILNPIRELVVTAKLCELVLPLRVIVAYWSLLWFINIIAEKKYWLSLSFESFQGTMDASLQEGGFQIRSSLVPLGPGSKVHDTFNNKNLFPTSGSQLRATTAVNNVLRVSWITMTNNS